jgi:DNA-binding MarR family transcriptional regulator
MSKRDALPYEITHNVRDTCLCLRVQRAARALARRFDNALRPLELTNGQFSMMMALNRPKPAHMAEVASLLAMDRTTLTAALKPLVRRGWVAGDVDHEDELGRQLSLTTAGLWVLFAEERIWKREHAAIERLLPDADADRLRADLRVLA